MNGLRPLLDRPRLRPLKLQRRRLPSPVSQAHGRRVPESAPPATRQSLRLGAVMFVQYALLALDVQFIATKHYVGIVVVNALIALNTWYLTRRVVQARTTWDRTWYITGGAAGAVIATWIT